MVSTHTVYGQFLSSSNIFIAPMKSHAAKLLLLIVSLAATALAAAALCYRWICGAVCVNGFIHRGAFVASFPFTVFSSLINVRVYQSFVSILF